MTFTDNKGVWLCKTNDDISLPLSLSPASLLLECNLFKGKLNIYADLRLSNQRPKLISYQTKLEYFPL